MAVQFFLFGAFLVIVLAGLLAMATLTYLLNFMRVMAEKYFSILQMTLASLMFILATLIAMFIRFAY